MNPLTEIAFRQMSDRRIVSLGDGSGGLITIGLNGTRIVSHFILNPELPLRDGRMNEEVIIDGDDLHGLLDMAVCNVKSQSPVWWMHANNIIRIFQRRFEQNICVSAARRNVAYHYDLACALYDLFLDRARQYSCAHFRCPDDTLEQAQAKNGAHRCQTALEAGHACSGYGLGRHGLQ
jgi:cyclopropane-fatty-acyl-phospholipid synthase